MGSCATEHGGITNIVGMRLYEGRGAGRVGTASKMGGSEVSSGHGGARERGEWGRGVNRQLIWEYRRGWHKGCSFGSEHKNIKTWSRSQECPTLPPVWLQENTLMKPSKMMLTGSEKITGTQQHCSITFQIAFITSLEVSTRSLNFSSLLSPVLLGLGCQKLYPEISPGPMHRDQLNSSLARHTLSFGFLLADRSSAMD